MKKILAMILAMLLVMSMTAAFATQDTSTKTFTVKFTDTNSGAHPAETFKFTAFTCTNVEKAGVGSDGNVVTTATAPTITTISDVTIAAGTNEGTATITLPDFQAVGIYTYTFNQVIGGTAGVTYYKNDTVQTMKLVVTVIQEDDGKKRIAAVHVENGTTASDKTDEITNTYQSGDLDVKKTVAGNMGDQSKTWHVKVKFFAPSDKTVQTAISYTDDNEAKTIEGGWTGNKEVEITLIHDETVSFTNIPEGVTYTVLETEANQDEYTTTGQVETAKEIAIGTKTTETITNTKEATPDTGIILQYAPYIAILAVVLAGAILLIIRRRRNNED